MSYDADDELDELIDEEWDSDKSPMMSSACRHFTEERQTILPRHIDDDGLDATDDDAIQKQNCLEQDMMISGDRLYQVSTKHLVSNSTMTTNTMDDQLGLLQAPRSRMYASSKLRHSLDEQLSMDSKHAHEVTKMNYTDANDVSDVNKRNEDLRMKIMTSYDDVVAVRDEMTSCDEHDALHGDMTSFDEEHIRSSMDVGRKSSTDQYHRVDIIRHVIGETPGVHHSDT